jgi:hypothetical protein
VGLRVGGQFERVVSHPQDVDPLEGCLGDGALAAVAPLVTWAKALESEGLAKLYSFVGKVHATLLPRVPGEESGPFTIWDAGYVTAFRTVLERRAPLTLAALDERLGKAVGKGSLVEPLDPPMLALMRAAFEEAAGKTDMPAKTPF